MLSVRVPVPRFTSRTLIVARRRAQSAPTHGPPSPSSTSPPESPRSTQRVASFVPVQVLSKTASSSRRKSRLAGVFSRAAVAGRLPGAGAPPPHRSRQPPSDLDRAVQIACHPGSN
jgi:hypothetical protein